MLDKLIEDMQTKGLLSLSVRPMTAEEGYLYKLKYDPSLKMWRYSEWKLAMRRQSRDEANKQFRLEVVRRLIQSGKWEEGQWGIE